MFGLSPAHLVIILIIALVVIGPGKLPEVGAALGKSIREFQKASGGVTEALTGATVQPQPQPQPPTQTPVAAQLPAHLYPVLPAYTPLPAPAPIAPTTYQPAPIANEQPGSHPNTD
jgi:sec-independent protein translocase protein TatA